MASSYPLLIAICFLSALGCASSGMHVPGSPRVSTYLQRPDGSGDSSSPVEGRLKPSVCEGINLRQEFRALTADDFVRFLESRGLKTEVTVARSDLVYVDVPNAGTREPLRFRVAVLADAGAAGRDLHVALLQHGAGRWGIHRSNLAVLATAGSAQDVVVFAARTRIACWGVLTIAGLDDTFVVPGGYLEL